MKTDKLDGAFLVLLGFRRMGSGSYTLTTADGTIVYAWKAPFSGYMLDMKVRTIQVHTRWRAAAYILAASVVHGGQIEPFTQPAEPLPAPVPVPEEPWRVMDDGLREAYAMVLVEDRRKTLKEYDFRVSKSQRHGAAGLYQIEGRKKHDLPAESSAR